MFETSVVQILLQFVAYYYTQSFASCLCKLLLRADFLATRLRAAFATRLYCEPSLQVVAGFASSSSWFCE
jgi:hypothetical protein